jgi:hypothetical protein
MLCIRSARRAAPGDIDYLTRKCTHKATGKLSSTANHSHSNAVSIGCSWLGSSWLSWWWQTKQDDWKYGTPRTFQTDQFVGHGDSPDHPNHFIAPKNDHVYAITTAIDPSTPVALHFQDTNHDGRIDLLVTIADANPYTVLLLNNGSQFTK